MTAPTSFKPGDRVVGRKQTFGDFTFGVVIGEGKPRPGGGAVAGFLAVQWDGETVPDLYVLPDQIALMPPAFQPKAPAAYRTALRMDDGSLDLSPRAVFETRRAAEESASLNAIERRGSTQVVCAIVPLAEVVAPPLVAPPVEVREL